MKRECRNCEFWQKLTDETSANGPAFGIELSPRYKELRSGDEGSVEIGECHRNAPAPGFFQLGEDGEHLGSWCNNAETRWPLTFPLEWCGEYKDVVNDEKDKKDK